MTGRLISIPGALLAVVGMSIVAVALKVAELLDRVIVAVAVHCQRDAAMLPDFDDHDLRDCTRHRGELEALGRATRHRPEPDWYRQDEGVRW